MSARRGRRPSRGRGRSARFTDPVEDIAGNPPVSTGPAVHAGQDTTAGIGMTTPVREAPGSSSGPATGFTDEAFGRQFMQMMQGAIRAAGVVPDIPISQILITNGARTFEGPIGAAPMEAEDWLQDVERRMDDLSMEASR